jgi:hypothetical protein
MNHTMIPMHYEVAFSGSSLLAEDQTIHFEQQNLGKLVVTTGRIVACDPFVMSDDEPFTQPVPVGRFPVEAAVAKFDDDSRVALCRVRFREGQVVRWEMALTPGQDASSLGPTNYFGYGVDTGTGCFMDGAATALIETLFEEHGEEALGDALEETYVDTWSHAAVVLEPSSGLNVIAFSSGFGDGAYPSYFGYSATGEVLVLVTDFLVLPD